MMPHDFMNNAKDAVEWRNFESKYGCAGSDGTYRCLARFNPLRDVPDRYSVGILALTSGSQAT